MKIIYLNVWHGKLSDVLNQFIKDQSETTDIFCFQEAYSEFLEQARKVLPNHKLFFCEKDIPTRLRQATFIRESVFVSSPEPLFMDEPTLGLGQLFQLKSNAQQYCLVNFHGVWEPGDKLDTTSRLAQSRGIIAAVRGLEVPAIIGGDFNVDINTESAKMFGKFGYRNLILENNIETTRNNFAWERFPGNMQFYSDYIFTDPRMTINSFSVPEVLVSDHLPLILDVDQQLFKNP